MSSCVIKKVTIEKVPFVKSDFSKSERNIDLLVPDYLTPENVFDCFEIIYLRATKKGYFRRERKTEKDIDRIAKLLRLTTQKYIDNQLSWTQRVLSSVVLTCKFPTICIRRKKV